MKKTILLALKDKNGSIRVFKVYEDSFNPVAAEKVGEKEYKLFYSPDPLETPGTCDDNAIVTVDIEATEVG